MTTRSTSSYPLRRAPVELTLDAFDLNGFVDVAAGFGCAEFAYVVTPNVDHMIRLHESGEFRRLYSAARFVLLDSRVAAAIFCIRFRTCLPVCPGSDLTQALLERVIRPDDRIVLVGASAEQAEHLRRRYGLRDLHHVNPPMGFAQDPAQVEATLAFVESASPFRFCLLAVGSPRQEMLAHRLLERGSARGLALCIGASVDFLTGVERRAPVWKQRMGLEWFHRLCANPRRLAHRYLVRGPSFFWRLAHQRLRVRPGVAPRSSA